MENKLEITENAENYIYRILSNDNSKYFRISVLGGGCSGFQYKFDFSNKKNNDDIILRENKIIILIDQISYEYIKGSKIDYVTELI